LLLLPLPLPLSLASAAARQLPAPDESLARIFLVFLKVGALLYGSGYVLLAFLQRDLVTRLGWLSEQQLLDAIAIGQFTPGPVFTTATFVGYVLGGAPGAAAATVAIFLPSFLFVALLNPAVSRVRASATAAALLDGVNVAALGLMAGVTWQLGRAALVDLPTVALAAVAVLLLFALRLNSAWVVLLGAGAGLVVRLLA
jgi:chromate transporter